MRRVGSFRPRSVALGCVLWAALGLVACGSSGDGQSKTDKTLAHETLATKTTGAKKQPEITVPPGPPPKNLVVRQLKEGFGVAAKPGDGLGVQYVGVNYRTGKPFEVRWQEPPPFSFTLGAGEVRKGWEIGLKGIRVGGRRELILPSRLAYGNGALVYVVELLSIE
jgi:FKBP-type peptidyl-prolyl cis-trans isomerase